MRQPRPVGASAWGFRRKVRYLLDSIFSFTDLPITADHRRRRTRRAVSTIWAAIVAVAWAPGRSTFPATRR